ncbi:MAG TPA: hypothetical protein VGB15_17695, partial [Longimicrobium sp.]
MPKSVSPDATRCVRGRVVVARRVAVSRVAARRVAAVSRDVVRRVVAVSRDVLRRVAAVSRDAVRRVVAAAVSRLAEVRRVGRVSSAAASSPRVAERRVAVVSARVVRLVRRPVVAVSRL